MELNLIKFKERKADKLYQVIGVLMSLSSMLDQKKFWDIVEYLLNLDKTKCFEDICSDLSISKQQLNSFIHFLREVNCDLEYHCQDGQKKIKAPDKLPTINVEFTLLEWLQFQANFPALSENQEKPYFDSIANKLAAVEQKYKQHDLFVPVQKLETTQSIHLVSLDGATQEGQANLQFIEESILDECPIMIATNEKKYALYPRSVVFLDGHLSLIAEAVGDHCLVKVDIRDITKAQECDHEWKPGFSMFEIDEFVLGLRAISENEVRLILKIYSQERFHLQLKHQIFGAPCMVTNPSGELIWAASVEPSNTIYEWIFQLGNSVEILDPNSFKKQYLKYCESKLKKLA